MISVLKKKILRFITRGRILFFGVAENLTPKRKSARAGKPYALGYQAGVSAWERGFESQSHSTPPSFPKQSFAAMTRYRTLGRFQLRAEKLRYSYVTGRYGLDPKMHGEVRRTGHLRAPSSHLLSKMSDMVSIVLFLSTGLDERKRCPVSLKIDKDASLQRRAIVSGLDRATGSRPIVSAF